MSGWKRSTYCLEGGCVEVNVVSAAVFKELVEVRQTDNPDLVLRFTRREWTAFIAGAKAGEFDL